MRKVMLLVSLVLLLTGCSGAMVLYSDIVDITPTAPRKNMSDDALKTGLYVSTDLSDSKSATQAEDGEANYDVTMVAVAVDDAGVIRDCVIDGIAAVVRFDARGKILTDIDTSVQTKNELGEAYGMKKQTGSRYEWNEQAAALADYALGKTVMELKNMAVDESGYARDADLAASASIRIGAYVDGIEQAARNACSLGARIGDQLRLASVSTLASSKDAAQTSSGNAQLNVDFAVVTMNNEVITSCILDSVQAVIAFDERGTITTDLSAPIQTKNTLGEDYGLKKYAGSDHEWNEQAAFFARYITGKTDQQALNIPVDEQNAPTGADLASSVTISIDNFREVIKKVTSNR